MDVNVNLNMNKALKPIEKLINAVKDGIGAFYEPYRIRALSKACADAMNTLGEAKSKNPNLNVNLNLKDLNISSDEYIEIIQRTGNRVLYQEVTRQINLETIADDACDEIRNKEIISDKKVSRDWIIRFFNQAGDITNRDMQKIWGKILAGEVAEPSTFSFRTLDVLHSMSTDEAKLFQKLSNMVFNNEFIIKSDVLNKFGINYNDILILDDCGLLNSSGLITVNINTLINPNNLMVLHCKNYAIVSGKSDNKKATIEVYPLTTAGKELHSIIDTSTIDINYLINVKNELNAHFNYDLKIYPIQSEGSNGVVLGTEPIN